MLSILKVIKKEKFMFRKFFSRLFFGLVLIAFNASAFATNLMANSSFLTLINDANYSATNTMLYTTATKDDFINYFPSAGPYIEVIGGTDISVTAYDDWPYYKGQCVGLIKVATNYASGVTATWGKGPAFNSSYPPPVRTVLAYFNGQSSYPTSGGHALIYLGTYMGSHVVIDQNWGNDKRIQIRMMSATSGSGRDNLSNYHIVTK